MSAKQSFSRIVLVTSILFVATFFAAVYVIRRLFPGTDPENWSLAAAACVSTIASLTLGRKPTAEKDLPNKK